MWLQGRRIGGRGGTSAAHGPQVFDFILEVEELGVETVHLLGRSFVGRQQILLFGVQRFDVLLQVLDVSVFPLSKGPLRHAILLPSPLFLH